MSVLHSLNPRASPFARSTFNLPARVASTSHLVDAVARARQVGRRRAALQGEFGVAVDNVKKERRRCLSTTSADGV